jgi:hypothetical protein
MPQIIKYKFLPVNSFLSVGQDNVLAETEDCEKNHLIIMLPDYLNTGHSFRVK